MSVVSEKRFRKRTDRCHFTATLIMERTDFHRLGTRFGGTMLVRAPRRYNRWLVLLFSVLIALSLPFAVTPTTAQEPQLRLGDMRVDWYCLQRGYGAWIVNNNVDWACTTPSGTVAFVLSQ